MRRWSSRTLSNTDQVRPALQHYLRDGDWVLMQHIHTPSLSLSLFPSPPPPSRSPPSLPPSLSLKEFGILKGVVVMNSYSSMAVAGACWAVGAAA